MVISCLTFWDRESKRWIKKLVKTDGKPMRVEELLNNKLEKHVQEKYIGKGSKICCTYADHKL